MNPTLETRVLPAGDRALLIEPQPGSLDALVDILRADPPPGVVDMLPAATTVLVTLELKVDLDALRRRLIAMAADPRRAPGAREAEDRTDLEVPVVYDGDDLADVAEHLQLSVEELIARHTAGPWRCAFIGFAPGFGYLARPEAELAVGRRAQARTSVPAGAVALADGYSAVYPRSTPGGWQLIGRTDLAFWDLARSEPSLVRPGTMVRFVPVSSR